MPDSTKHERFLELLQPLEGRLSQYCRAMTRDAEAGRDLLGDVVLAAYERFESIRDGRAFPCFIFTIARRIHRRRAKRGRIFGRYDEHAAERIGDDRPSPGSSADIEMLYRALEQLPEKQREAVVMFELSGLSLQEIRDVQGGSISGVKTRLMRGRRELARLLGVNDDGADPATTVRQSARPNRSDAESSTMMILSGYSDQH